MGRALCSGPQNYNELDAPALDLAGGIQLVFCPTGASLGINAAPVVTVLRPRWTLLGVGGSRRRGGLDRLSLLGAGSETEGNESEKGDGSMFHTIAHRSPLPGCVYPDRKF